MSSPLGSKNEDGISGRQWLISTTYAERVSLGELCCSQGKEAVRKSGNPRGKAYLCIDGPHRGTLDWEASWAIRRESASNRAAREPRTMDL